MLKKDGGGTEEEEQKQEEEEEEEEGLQHEVKCRRVRLGVCRLIGFDAGESVCVLRKDEIDERISKKACCAAA